MIRQINQYVKAHPKGYELAGMDCHGTVTANVDGFAAVCGESHHQDPGGAHSQHYWYFETPRGRACVQDFHTLPHGLLAILSVDPGAARWLARYLRHANLKVQLYRSNK